MYSIRELERYIVRFVNEAYKNPIQKIAARVILDAFIEWLKKQEGSSN